VQGPFRFGPDTVSVSFYRDTRRGNTYASFRQKGEVPQGDCGNYPLIVHEAARGAVYLSPAALRLEELSSMSIAGKAAVGY
jgi:hypothetical protein